MNRKTEFLATIKPILEKQEAKQDAAKLAKELSGILNQIDFGADGSGLTELKDVFNAQLAEMGKQPIVFSESTLRGIVSQFAGAVSEGLKAGVASVDIEVAELTKQRASLLAERDALNKQIKHKTLKEELSTFDSSTVKPLKVSGNLEEEALRIKKEYKEAWNALQEFTDDEGNIDTTLEGYEEAVLNAQQKAVQLIRMNKTLVASKDTSLDKLRKWYAGEIEGTTIDESTTDYIDELFEPLNDVFVKQSERLDAIQAALQNVNVKIEELQSKKIDIISDDDKADISSTLKSLEEIEAAHKRISTQKGELRTTPAKELNAALYPEKEFKSLLQLSNEYNSAYESGANWEKLYTSAVRFVNKFEADLKSGQISKNGLPEFTKLYDKLTPIVNDARESLKLLAEFKPVKKQSNATKTAEEDANVTALHENNELLKQLIGDREKSVFYDSKTGKYSRVRAGDSHRIETSLSDIMKASKDFDTAIHSHTYNVAAPSIFGEGNDMDTWLRSIEYIKKRAIVARNEVLSFDFSSLKDGDLQNIITQYREAATIVQKEFDDIIANRQVGDKFGTMKNLEEAFQARLREELEKIMAQFPGVMFSSTITSGIHDMPSEEKTNARRKELTQQLDKYGGDVLDSKTADDNLEIRKEIFKLLQDEGLLTDEIKRKYDEVNQRLEARADLIREAEGYYDDINDTVSGIRVDAIDSEEQYRKDHLDPFDAVVDKMRASGVFSEEELEKSFYEVLDVMESHAQDIGIKSAFDELDNRVVNPEDVTDVNELNRLLQERRDIIERTGDYYLEQYDRDAYEDALKHNQLIEDRIAMLQKASLLENLYNNAPESIKKIVDEMVVLEHQMRTLKERTAGTTLNGFFKFDPSDEHKAYIINTFKEYERVIKEISECPIVESEDDKKRLIELQEEAARLGATLHQAHMSDSTNSDYARVYGISMDDATNLRAATGNDGRQWRNRVDELLRGDYNELYDALNAADNNLLQTIINKSSQWEELSKTIVNRVNVETTAQQGVASSAEVDSLRQQLEEASKRADEAEKSAKSERIKREMAEEAYDDLHDDLYDAQKQTRAAEDEAERLREELSKKHTDVPSVTGDTDTGTEASRLTILKESVEAVTNAVNLKTQAFRDEQTAVDQVVDAEVESLGKLESKITTIKDIFEGLVNNIRNGSDDIGAGLNNVNINVNYPENTQATLDQEALNKLADVIKQAQTKTPETAIDAAGKALATENTLLAIKTAVESIDGKTIKGSKVGSGSNRKSTTADDYKGSPFFGEKLKTREMELAKFVQKLMNEGQDTPKMQDAVKQLRDALKLVNSGEKLSVWDQKFRQAKLAVGIDELKEKPDEQESVQTYKNLIAYAKEYYSIVEKHEKAKENTQRKAILAQQKQDAETFMQDGGLDLDTLELGDEAYNKKLSDLRDRHKRNLEVIKADKSDTTNSQQIKKESDALKVLLGLYKEYGELDAKWNYSDGKNDAAEQERQMLDVYKKIQEQKASMGISDDDTRYDKEITKAWEQGFKDIENVKRSARAKALDKSDAQRIKEEVQKVEKYVKELGALEADLQFGFGDKETAEINRQIEQKQRYINLKKEELELDEKDLLIQQTTAYQNRYNSSARKDSRAQDKADDAATTKRNNEAYERLVQLRRTQYDLEKKLSSEKEGSKLADTYQSQLSSIKQLIANQKTLVHYNEKYEKQLADMADAHKRNKEQWESSKIDDARAEALAAEKKEVKELADAYAKLGKLVAARDYATTKEKRDAIQETINKRVKEINSNSRNNFANRDELISAFQQSKDESAEKLSIAKAEKDGIKRTNEEKKAVDALSKSYELLGKKIAARNYATSDEAKNAIQETINKQIKDIRDNPYNTPERRAGFISTLKQSQEAQESILRERSANKAGQKRLSQEMQQRKKLMQLSRELGALDSKREHASTDIDRTDLDRQIKEKEAELAIEKQDIQIKEQHLKVMRDFAKAQNDSKITSQENQAKSKEQIVDAMRLAKELGDLQAQLDFSTTEIEIEKLIDKIDRLAKELYNLVDGTGINKSSVDAAINKSYNASYSKKETANIHSQGKAAIEEEKDTIKELNDLYKQLGQAEAKRDMTAQNSAQVAKAKEEYDDIEKEINAKRQLIKIDDKLENQFTDSWMSGVEAETKSPIGNLTKAYEKLGKLRAEIDQTPAGDYLDFLKRQLVLKSKLLEVESDRLGISQHEKESNRLKAEDVYNSEMFKWQGELAKKKDKERNDEQAKLFKQQIKQSKELAKVNQATSAINKADSTLNLVSSIGGWSGEHVARLNEYSDKLRALKDQYTEIKYSDGVVTADQQEELINQTLNVNKLTEEINELIANYNRLSGENTTVLGADTLGSSATIGDYKKQLTDLVMAHTNGKASITGFDAATKELTYTVQTGKYEFTEYTVALRQADGQIVKLEGNTKRLETPMEKLKRKMSEILTYFGGSSLIYEFFGQFRQGVQYVRDIDSALTELKKVTDETEESYDRFLETAAKTADKVGSTITNIVSSTADWARLGFSMEEAAQLAESTSVLLNVSEFSSIEDATSALTSTMQAFGYVAKDSMHVVDVLNEVGKLVARR